MTFVWSRTFPDTHHDFVAEEDGVQVGRIYRHRYGGAIADTWFWTVTGVHIGREAAWRTSGDEATREAAIAALTRSWETAKGWSARPGRSV